MVKALCSCGFYGDLEDLKIINHGNKGRLSCPTCKLSTGLDYVEQGKNKIIEKKSVGDDNKKEKIEHRTTENDFELFKKCIKYWVKHFGLYGWDILLLHQEDEDSLAYTRFNIPNRSVSIILAKNWGDRVVTDIEIDKTAFHEVGELLMMRIRFIAEARFLTEEEAGEEIHNIIRILENVIWEPKLLDLDNRIQSAAKIVEDTVKEYSIKVRNNTLLGEN